MIDTLYQDETNRVLDDQVKRPLMRPARTPDFSAAGLAAAPFKGIGASFAESLGFAGEIAGAYGQVSGATYTGDMFGRMSPDQRKQTDEAWRKLQKDGVNYSNEAGDIFRQRAVDIMPDPQTSHESEQVVAGLTKFASKAIGYAATTGPAAPFLLAGDEGLAEADRLKQQGVDLATRTKAGAVSGVTAGVSIVLPVAGTTKLGTAGLVAVGGPGGFMAQNAATRYILEHAGYDKIAEHYDPFDPLGLTLSTLVPGAFGVMAMRGRTSRALTKEQEAGQTVVQADPDSVSAARVQQTADIMDSTRLSADGDIAGANAHISAVQKAHDQIAAGERVNVADLVVEHVDPVKARLLKDQEEAYLRPFVTEEDPFIVRLPEDQQPRMLELYRRAEEEKPKFDATLRELAESVGATLKTAELKGTDRAVAKVLNDYGGDASRIKDLLRATIKADSVEAAQRAVAGIFEKFTVLKEGRRNLLDPSKNTIDGYRDAKFNVEVNGHIAEIQVNIPSMLAAKKAVHKLYTEREAIRREIEGLNISDVPKAKLARIGELNEKMRAAYEPAWAEATMLRNSDSPMGAPLREADSAGNTRGGITSQAAEYGASRTAPIETGMPSTSKNSADASNLAGSTEGEGSRFMGTSKDILRLKVLDGQVDEIQALNPDMLVRLDGMNEPVRIGDLLRDVQKAADGEVKESSLLQVAVNCFLRSS